MILLKHCKYLFYGPKTTLASLLCVTGAVLKTFRVSESVVKNANISNTYSSGTHIALMQSFCSETDTLQKQTYAEVRYIFVCYLYEIKLLQHFHRLASYCTSLC
jgi:hypothetical protein